MNHKSLMAASKTASVGPGTLAMWMGTASNIPAGWTIANGSAVSRTLYPELFEALNNGAIYGTGDGSTTFNLPNLLDGYGYPKFDSYAAGKLAAGVPNITGAFNTEALCGGITGYALANGAFYTVGANRQHLSCSVEEWNYDYYFNAARCSSVYGNASTVQPASTTVIPIIKLY